MRPQVIFHIGYHKTGTTFLQESLFNSDEFNQIDRFGVQKFLLSKSPYEYDKNEFQSWLFENCVNDKVNIVSDEELTGNIHTGGNGRSITYEVIERISELDLIDVKVLLVIRNQVQMIDSCYRQYVKKGGCYSLDKYLNSSDYGSFRHRFPKFSLDHFKYDSVALHLHNKIGSAHVLILPYESIKQNICDVIFKAFLTSGFISQRLEIDKSNYSSVSNPSYSTCVIPFARITNRFVSTDPICSNSICTSKTLYKVFKAFYHAADKYFFTAFRCSKLVFDSEQVEKINIYFRESNKNLSVLLSINLKELGYSVSD